jgi:hypothetical protein
MINTKIELGTGKLKLKRKVTKVVSKMYDTTVKSIRIEDNTSTDKTIA